jgi:hypothetical protein
MYEILRGASLSTYVKRVNILHGKVGRNTSISIREKGVGATPHITSEKPLNYLCNKGLKMIFAKNFSHPNYC